MSSIPRDDEPGAWHHVMNRAVGRRPFFESEREIRSFLALVARSVRSGWIEVHAFAILPNHFHLLVRSPTGELSKAMKWIQAKYVMSFNRVHDRDGPLVRGRFRSKRVRGREYRHLLVGYIDWNPVAAGLCATPESYRYGSSRCYVRGVSRPWLSHWMVEELLGGELCPARYRRSFRPSASQIELCERRLEVGDSVVPGGVSGFATEGDFQTWMRKRAMLADGDVRRAEPLVGETQARTAIAQLTDASLPKTADPRVDVAGMLAVGLMRSMSGLTFASIAATLGVSTQTVHRRWGRHGDEMRTNAEYREFFVELAGALVQREREMC